MDLQSLAIGGLYVVTGVVVLLLSKLIKDYLSPYRVDQELSEKDNPAFGLVLVGYFVGVASIFVGASLGELPDEPLTTMQLFSLLFVDMLYALGGVVALLIGRVVLDKIALRKFRMIDEILRDRNVGSGAVECGAFIATGLTVAGAVHGEGGGPLSALVFFLLGQLCLVLFVMIYQVVVKYDVHGEIERDNVAAGVALGLNMVAVGIILLKGISGDLGSWQDKLTWFFLEVSIGTALLLVLRRFTDALFLPNTTLSHEIVNDRNLNAAWIEGTLATSVAAIIFFMV